MIVGGDMPWLVPEVLSGLVAAVESGSESDVAVLESDGRVQQLPVAVRRTAALAAARTLTDGGVRRLGRSGRCLASPSCPKPCGESPTPTGQRFAIIDEPGDLPPAEDWLPSDGVLVDRHAVHERGDETRLADRPRLAIEQVPVEDREVA